MRETDGVMAEAALKLRLPPLRKDTLDWRDMMACSRGARWLVSRGWEVLERTELSKMQKVAVPGPAAPFYPLEQGWAGRLSSCEMIKWAGHAWGAAVSSPAHLHSGGGANALFLAGSARLGITLPRSTDVLAASCTSPRGPRAVSSPRRMPGRKGAFGQCPKGSLQDQGCCQPSQHDILCP